MRESGESGKRIDYGQHRQLKRFASVPEMVHEFPFCLGISKWNQSREQNVTLDAK